MFFVLNPDLASVTVNSIINIGCENLDETGMRE